MLILKESDIDVYTLTLRADNRDKDKFCAELQLFNNIFVEVTWSWLVRSANGEHLFA